MFKELNIDNLSDATLDCVYDSKYSSVIVDLPLYSNDFIQPYNTSNLNLNFSEKVKKLLDNACNLIENKGLLFVYGTPVQLMNCYNFIPNSFKFRYWIALDSKNFIENDNKKTLKHNHIGLLMFSKGNQFIDIDTKNVRISYMACSACHKNIKDWGGKKHLMNIIGTGLSDVWKDFYHIKEKIMDQDNPQITLNLVDTNMDSSMFNSEKMPSVVLDRLKALLKEKERNILYLNITKQFLPNTQVQIDTRVMKDSLNSYLGEYDNRLIHGDCISVMEKIKDQYPNGIFDLVFADPPYNLEKNYKEYNDEISSQKYIEWCNKWLSLCVDLTKPTGNILILNIPKWALEHSKMLNKIAYFNNWIVWDALSLPKGKIMPAHYALLSYSKNYNINTYNKLGEISSPEYCLRANCIKKRVKEGINRTIPVSDIWFDIHRIKHKKDRDDHPCQLPEKLMDRIIQMYSNPGDLVFDPFCGTGTTALSAIKNNRKYTTIELDDYYVSIAKEKINQLEQFGSLQRKHVHKKISSIYTKKDLENKVQILSQRLGRKPLMDEFIEAYNIDYEQLKLLYEEPKNVLKAGRIALLNNI